MALPTEEARGLSPDAPREVATASLLLFDFEGAAGSLNETKQQNRGDEVSIFRSCKGRHRAESVPVPRRIESLRPSPSPGQCPDSAIE